HCPDRVAAAHVEAHAVDHAPSSVALFELVPGQIAARGLLPDGFSARPWTARSRFLGTGSRHRPAQACQADVLPAAVARFASRSRRATVSKQRENVEHASALKAPPKRPQWNRAAPSHHPPEPIPGSPSWYEGSAYSKLLSIHVYPSQLGRSAVRARTGAVIFSQPCCFSPRCCADQEGFAARLEICHRPARRPSSTHR